MDLALGVSLGPAERRLVLVRFGAIMFVATVLQLVAFAIAASPAAQRVWLPSSEILRVVVTVDRIIIDLMFALVKKGIGAIEQVVEPFYLVFRLAAQALQRFKELFVLIGVGARRRSTR